MLSKKTNTILDKSINTGPLFLLQQYFVSETLIETFVPKIQLFFSIDNNSISMFGMFSMP